MPSAKFKFALEPLLKIRRLHEQSQQRAVAEIERQRLALEEALRRQQQHLADGKHSMRAQLVGRINTADLRMHAASSIGVMRMAQRSVLELAGVHRRMDAARQDLIEAVRRRRVVELLRDRRFEQWKSEVDRTETEMLDELAIMAAARKRDGIQTNEQASQT